VRSLETIPTPVRQRLRRARVGILPLVIWIGAVGLTMKLWLAAPRTSTYFGLAHAPKMNVASPVDGGLDMVLVDLFQTVAAGEPLAVMDQSGLEARLATAGAEVDRLAADLAAQRATLEVEDAELRREASVRHGAALSVAGLEYPAELRAFHETEARFEVRILETRLAITTRELEADRVEVRLRRAEGLVERDIGPIAEVQDLENRLTQELARAEGLRLIEASLNAELEQARDRRRALEASHAVPPMQMVGDPALEARLAGWKAALVVQKKRMDELTLSREAYVLRAPAAGRVATLVASNGQYLLQGDLILVLMDPEPAAVEMWVPEARPTTPQVGDRYLITRVVDHSAVVSAECVVQTMSPRFEVMPQRLWRNPRVAEYGRACMIGPVAALGLVPGERVGIEESSSITVDGH